MGPLMVLTTMLSKASLRLPDKKTWQIVKICQVMKILLLWKRPCPAGYGRFIISSDTAVQMIAQIVTGVGFCYLSHCLRRTFSHNLAATVAPFRAHINNVIGHFDHETGTSDRYSCGQGLTSEPIFVPASADAGEGEGYLLAVVTSFETRTSSLFIFDAMKVSSGPLAKVHLSHRVPAGFHGGWRPSS